MSATEDESQSLDAGWDDEPRSEPGEDDVDSAWDNLPPPLSGAAASLRSSLPPAAEEEAVDSGWDDVPQGSPVTTPGKRRPHRQRRTKANAPLPATNPVLLPRPAEPTKKHQREHARKQRAYESQLKQQRKDEKKAQRAAQAREEAAARLRQTEAEEQARRLRRETRELAEREKARSKRVTAKSPSSKRHVDKKPEALPVKAEPMLTHTRPPKSGLRPGVVITLLAIAAIVALLVLRK